EHNGDGKLCENPAPRRQWGRFETTEKAPHANATLKSFEQSGKLPARIDGDAQSFPRPRMCSTAVVENYPNNPNYPSGPVKRSVFASKSRRKWQEIAAMNDF
ncbi:MAG: hypothetical protein FWG03_07280, partial [Clostridiales bacterium]|nr:hypothetical protein [Clostridiales bacterium]